MLLQTGVAASGRAVLSEENIQGRLALDAKVAP